MKLSAWLNVLAAILGLAKAKPKDIERTERAAAATEAVEAAIEAAKEQPPTK